MNAKLSIMSPGFLDTLIRKAKCLDLGLLFANVVFINFYTNLDCKDELLSMCYYSARKLLEMFFTKFISLTSREPEPELTPEERDVRTVFCMQLAARIRPRDLEEFFSSVGKVTRPLCCISCSLMPIVFRIICLN